MSDLGCRQVRACKVLADVTSRSTCSGGEMCPHLWLPPPTPFYEQTSSAVKFCYINPQYACCWNANHPRCARTSEQHIHTLHPGRETETHANKSVLNTENSLSAARCTMKSRFAPTLSIYHLLKTAVTAMISIIPAMLSV